MHPPPTAPPCNEYPDRQGAGFIPMVIFGRTEKGGSQTYGLSFSSIPLSFHKKTCRPLSQYKQVGDQQGRQPI